MPVDPVQAQTLILLAVAANLLVMAAVVVPPLLGRHGPLENGSAAGDPGERKTAELAAVLGEAGTVACSDSMARSTAAARAV